MNRENLKELLEQYFNDIVFVYQGRMSGVTSVIRNCITVYQVWFGSDTKEYTSIFDMLEDKFFDGEALGDISEQLQFTVL